MSDGQALLLAMRANPGDDTCPLVFADWCEEYGDPFLAEFLRLSVEYGRAPTPALLERICQLRAALGTDAIASLPSRLDQAFRDRQARTEEERRQEGARRQAETLRMEEEARRRNEAYERQRQERERRESEAKKEQELRAKQQAATWNRTKDNAAEAAGWVGLIVLAVVVLCVIGLVVALAVKNWEIILTVIGCVIAVVILIGAACGAVQGIAEGIKEDLRRK